MMRECGLDTCVSGKGPLAASCEHDNEPSGSAKGRRISCLTEGLPAS
jgi:hypothetical protein